MAIVFDQTLYRKATVIVWNNLPHFKLTVLRMGMFQTTCNMMAVIGKRYGDAVESGGYFRGTYHWQSGWKEMQPQLQKLKYEALSSMVGFFNLWLNKHHLLELPNPNEAIVKL